jgi:hypothetical protein
MEKQAEEYIQVESLVSPVLGYGIFASLCSEERIIIGALIFLDALSGTTEWSTL